ncbi:hypothetical protein ABIE00_002388 [Arthrobacter sp. OAP107]
MGEITRQIAEELGLPDTTRGALALTVQEGGPQTKPVSGPVTSSPDSVTTSSNLPRTCSPH